MKRLTYLLSAILLTGLLTAEPIKPAKTPPEPAFNRLYPNADVVKLLKAYAEAYPDWLKLESVGKGSEGDDIWAVTITNPKTGSHLGKPGMYIDGATHANEIQGTEVCLYVINFVLKNYGKLPRVTELLDRGSIYLIPMVNVDSRRRWFTQPATPNFPRTIPVKIDDDRDGKFDEDGYEDLDGDGEITMMRKRVPPGQGRFKLDPKDPRQLVPVQGDELGEWLLLGSEGIDNDGDGLVNEDTIGYIDPNRTFGGAWQPRYVQVGSSDYPLQYPETRSVADFMERHPNIIAGQSFHNAGGYILRGPGALGGRPYPQADLRAYDFVGKEGERMLPFYKYGTPLQTLGYAAFGGTFDHLYYRNGIFCLSNELNTGARMFGAGQPVDSLKFNDVLTQGRQFVDWKAFKHPQYGDIEIGGFKHDTGRPPEGFLLEEECHRNALFALFHAHQMPHVAVQETKVAKISEGLWRVEATLLNDRALPSMAQIAQDLKLHRPDIATVTGGKVIASGTMASPLSSTVDYQTHRPERLMVNGVPGFGTRTLMFLVEGTGAITLEYDSVKAGKVTRRIPLTQ